MQLTTRPLITAAVVLTGAGFITATPVAAAALPEIQTAAVQLTSFDPNSWLDVLQH